MLFADSRNAERVKYFQICDRPPKEAPNRKGRIEDVCKELGELELIRFGVVIVVELEKFFIFHINVKSRKL